MSNLAVFESDKRKRIHELLESFGVKDSIIIDNEAEDAILGALTAPDVEEVFIDHEGALVINFSGDTQ